MTVALEEFSVVGNDLVSRSIHPSQPAHPPSIQETSNRPAEAAVSELPLSSGRIINPIPYVQNAVREVHPTRPRPEPTTAGIGQTLSQFFRFRSPAERVPPEEQEQLAHGNKSVLKSNNQRVPSGFPSLVKVNNIRQQPEVAPSSAIDGCDNTLSVDLAV